MENITAETLKALLKENLTAKVEIERHRRVLDNEGNGSWVENTRVLVIRLDDETITEVDL